MDIGKRKTGYAVATLEGIVETKALRPENSAQKVELIALVRVLDLSHGKRISVYADSRYAFLIMHAHGSFWNERR